MKLKLIPFVICILIAVSFIRADDIMLSDGSVLKNAKITGRDEGKKTVTVTFSGGTAEVANGMLPTSQGTPAMAQTVAATTNAIPLPTPDAVPPAGDWTVKWKTYHNVAVTQVEADRVEVSYDGGVGSFLLVDLPPELQKRFNYDPVAAKQVTEDRAKQQAEADAELAAQMRQQAQADAAQAEQQRPHKTTRIMGKVYQKIPGGGLLVACQMGGAPNDATGYNNEDEEEVFMLKGMPNEADLVDNEGIQEVVYRSGSYSYTSMQGVQKTIAAYTAVKPYKPTGGWVAPGINP